MVSSAYKGSPKPRDPDRGFRVASQSLKYREPKGRPMTTLLLGTETTTGATMSSFTGGRQYWGA